MSARLAAAGAVFVAAYYALFAAGLPQWTADAALVVPAGAAALLLARRAAAEHGRARWFFALLALGSATWVVADGLWAAAEYIGHSPYSPIRDLRGYPLVFDSLFLGFLLPVLGALALRAHGTARRPGALALVDASLAAAGIAFAFLRVSFLPLVARPNSWRALQTGLWFVLAVWAAVLWRLQPDPRWRRRYGAVAAFAISYSLLATVADGLGRVLAPGGPADLAWVLPFFLLAAAAGDAADPGPRRDWTPLLVLLCGAGPLVFDSVLSLMLPAVGLDLQEAPAVVLGFTVLFAAGCAARLRVEELARGAAGERESREAEEERRAARLADLARVAGPMVPRIQAAVEEVWARTAGARAALGDKAERALEQAGRARDLARRLTLALRPPDRAREEVELAALVEACVHRALQDGPALDVSLEGLGALPSIRASRESLAGCLVQLIRNAAQASPGGGLEISGVVEDGMVVLRFRDDGPGVPRELRHRIFEPFFTTRRVGEGYGLGLTEVHFLVRDHGGSVVVEETDGGACIAVRLPVTWAAVFAPQAQDWPLPAAIVVAAAAAVVLVVLPSPALRQAWSVSLQVASALLAAGALAWTASRHTGRARAFWAALAAGPALWGLTRALRMLEGGLGAADRGNVWHFGAYAAAELAFVVALLARPDRPRERIRPAPSLLGAAALFCLCAYLYSYLVLLPAPFSLWDADLRRETALWRGGLRLLAAGWALLLAARATSAYWRSVFARLGAILGVWAVGQAFAGVARALPDYQAGALTDLGWIAPLLLLAGFALVEARRSPSPGSLPAAPPPPHPLWRAAELASLAALPAFDALAGPSAHPALDVARSGMTWTAVVVVAALLSAREYLALREPPARGRRRVTSAPAGGSDPERLLKVVSTAVYEMAGHLSGIAALARLVLTQSDASGRVRGDSERIHARADVAARIARNLIALLKGGSSLPELTSLNRLVVEVAQLRAPDLAHEGVTVTHTLDPHLPAAWWPHASAVRQALLSCVDAAAVALRNEGRAGAIDLATARQGDELVVRVRGDGQGLPRALLAPLSSSRFGPGHDSDLGLGLARDILALCGGSLGGRYRAQGGTELVMRLPMSTAPTDPDLRWPGPPDRPARPS